MSDNSETTVHITPDMYFNRYVDIEKTKNDDLPHWNQKDKLQFITFRLADSMPSEILRSITIERNDWLRLHPQPWDEATEREYNEKIVKQVDHWLDAGHGCCILQNKIAADAIINCLQFKHGEQYNLIAFVVMPNHVHVLIQVLSDSNISNIVKSWKGVSANRINKQLNLSGTLWQREYFDTIIRSSQHFAHVVRYIEYNYNHGGVAMLTTSKSDIIYKESR